jgi:hypothetical protein
MLRKMEAEIVFLDPNDASPGSAALIKHGFEIEVMDRISDYDSRVWILAKTTSEFDAGDILELVTNLTDPLGGDALQAGPAPIERCCEVDSDTRPGKRDDVKIEPTN